jgi:hypothetical protein
MLSNLCRKTTNTTTMATARYGPLVPQVDVKNSTKLHRIDQVQCPKQVYILFSGMTCARKFTVTCVTIVTL